MFESVTRDLDALVAALAGLTTTSVDADRIDVLDRLERVKGACAAAQVRVTVELAESQARLAEEWRQRAQDEAANNDFDAWRAAREAMRQASCPEADDGSTSSASTSPGGGSAGRSRSRQLQRGVAGQVALARRESPHTGSRLVGMAFALTHEMPYLLGLMERGLVSERRAALVVQECAALSLDQRAQVDTELHVTLGEELGRLSVAELASRVRAITYRLDPQAVVERSAHAGRERRVTLRPAPDTMCWLTALLPAAQGVAAFAALTKAADSARAAGDPRSKGQVMADTLVERVTGQAAATDVSVELQLVVTDSALLAGDATPARLSGYGTVPAAWARQLVRHGSSHGTSHASTGTSAGDVSEAAQVWLRRLYADPDNGTLLAMDSRRRVFDGSLRRFLVARDGGICRTPGCGAPIRHVDHVAPHAAGGTTATSNGQGLCVRCNLVKELLGWRARVVSEDDRHTVEITTPTGHRYRSNAPPVVYEDPNLPLSPLERRLEADLAA